MALRLNELRADRGARRKPKRLGRGHASGQGQQAGRGHKGQGSRAGGGVYAGHEGGQKPLYKRTPKLRGFQPAGKIVYAVVNAGRLEAAAGSGAVNLAALIKSGVVRKNTQFLKILGGGEIKTALTVQAHAFSAAAKEKIQQAGGSVQTLQIVK
ncbi:MAG: 50S ribosomal protein L15 [Candidatus Margulisbacteria bacterium]|jgi:large subunit ribosomal protein L15|nr:50S ribosomal protein L15 [Candidatus Margulisiibacteriota bacterium]